MILFFCRVTLSWYHSQRRQFDLNCKRNVALKFTQKLLHYLPKITLHIPRYVHVHMDVRVKRLITCTYHRPWINAPKILIPKFYSLDELDQGCWITLFFNQPVNGVTFPFIFDPLPFDSSCFILLYLSFFFFSAKKDSTYNKATIQIQYRYQAW